jgi:hypothetical protein
MPFKASSRQFKTLLSVLTAPWALLMVFSLTTVAHAQDPSPKLPLYGHEVVSVDQRGACPARMVAEFFSVVANPPNSCLDKALSSQSIVWTGQPWEGRVHFEVAGSFNDKECGLAVDNAISNTKTQGCAFQITSKHTRAPRAGDKDVIKGDGTITIAALRRSPLASLGSISDKQLKAWALRIQPNPDTGPIVDHGARFLIEGVCPKKSRQQPS